jgi:serine/threonine-protein kinase RsbW
VERIGEGASPNPAKTWRKRAAMASSSPTSTANGDARTVRLTIPAKAEYITLVRLALSGLSNLRPLDDETLGDLKLAVTEACSNSVRHAYREGREGAVQVVYELHPDRLVVEVSDEGDGFPVEQSLAVTGGSLTEGGLGIAIIRELADELEFGPRENGKGSRLRFVKFIEE